MSFDFEPPELEATELCFPSGLRLQVVRQPAGGAVALTTVVPAGTSAETDTTRGAAHLVEHLALFRARPGGGPPVWEQGAGLSLQGLTKRDATVYVTIGAAADLDRLLALEAARLADPLAGVTEADLQAEKRIVNSEGVFRGEHGWRAAFRTLQSRMYPEGHPYHTGLHDPDDIAALDLETLRSWAGEHYGPTGATLRIEGDVPGLAGDQWADRLEAAFGAEALFAGSSKCPSPPSGKAPEEPVSTELLEVSAPVLEPTLFVGWTLPPSRGADAVRMRMASDKLNLRWGDACSLSPGVHSSELVCVLAYDDVDELRDAHRKVVKWADDAWSDELPDYWAGSGYPSVEARTFTSTLLLADHLADDALAERALLGHLTGELDPLAPMMATVFDEAKSLDGFGRKWLTSTRAAAVALVPAGREIDAGLPLPGKARLDVPSEPEPFSAAALDPKSLEHRTLDNGVEAWVLKAGTSPVAVSSLVFAGGRLAEPAVGAVEVLERLRRYQMPRGYSEVRNSVGVASFEGFYPVTTHTLAEGAAAVLPNMLWIQRAKLEGLSLDFAERQNELDAGLKYSRDLFESSPWLTLSSLRRQRLLPGHRAGLPWWEELLAARRAPEGQVWSWARSIYHPAGSQLVVVGDVHPTQTLGDAARYLGNYKGKGKGVVPAAPALPPPPDRQVLALGASIPLSEVVVTCRLPGRAGGSDAALDVLRALLERGMWLGLREDGGNYAFGVDVDPVTPQLSLLTMTAPVAPAQAEGAVGLLLALLELVEAGVEEQAVAYGRAAAAGAWGRQWASALSASTAVQRELAAGVSMTDLQAWPDRAKAVDAAALSALLGDCVGHEVVSVTGPQPKAASWEAFDWQAFGTELYERLQ